VLPSLCATRATLIPPPPGSRFGAEQRNFLVGSTRETFTKMSIAGLIVIVAMSGISVTSVGSGQVTRVTYCRNQAFARIKSFSVHVKPAMCGKIEHKNKGKGRRRAADCRQQKDIFRTD
jgi:hypothetical protein